MKLLFKSVLQYFIIQIDRRHPNSFGQEKTVKISFSKQKKLNFE